LEVLNLTGGELLDLLGAVEIVNFREARTNRTDDYDIALLKVVSVVIPRFRDFKKYENRQKSWWHWVPVLALAASIV